MSKALKKILSRVPTWPKAAQAELVRVAREIEEDFVIDPHLMDDLDEVHQAALSEQGVSLEQIKEGFEPYHDRERQ